ncbi:MAG: hypothetical protein ACRDQ1_11130, partial [Sciscionella sp.]
AGNGLGTKPGQLGQFDRDIQVFAYLMTCHDIRERLTEINTELAAANPETDAIERFDLRLLDVALWTAANPS